MDILVACHNETEDAPLFIYQQPLFDSPAKLVADYIDPYSSGKHWKDYPNESKDVIWDEYCPVMWPFYKVRNYFYHDSIFYNLFDDGWNILKPGGMIVLPFPKDFRNIHTNKVISTETALDNFRSVLKRLLSKHPWTHHIVKRESMPFIIAEQYEQEKHNTFIIFTKPIVLNNTRKARKSRRNKTRRN